MNTKSERKLDPTEKIEFALKRKDTKYERRYDAGL